MEITTSIIPTSQTFAKVDAPSELNLEAICVFAAIGFFLDRDTYIKNQIVLPPASKNSISKEGYLESSKSWFQWYYEPRDISFAEALNEFTELFEGIIAEQTKDQTVILPLSGGLDSRTQAAALKSINANVNAYSYEFRNGYSETKIAKKIADRCGFAFESHKIESGYLWPMLDALVQLNKGYSDFTSPRQMALFNKYEDMGDIFSLGHWGDVLFDSMHVNQLSNDEELEVVLEKLLKRGGMNFAQNLWDIWGLNGNFKTYFKERIFDLLNTINISDFNAKIRAFKSKYWAPRWTAINLAIYEAKKPIAVPYFDDRMCQFICTIPEEYLMDRKLQIAYVKERAPELAKITWQDQRPFNLINFHKNRVPYNLPYKIFNRIKRDLNGLIGNSYVQRNWELQFLGKQNEEHLRSHLQNFKMPELLPKSFVDQYLDDFTTRDQLSNAHAINMLLVLSTLDPNLLND